jgi:tRNA nucleotidyltransferase (CCA-adding enzyme)
MEFPPRIRSWLVEGRAKAISVAQEFYRKQDLKPSAIYHLLEALNPEWLLFIMAKTEREETRRAISLYFRKLGPVYREILDGLLDGRLNGELSSREEEVEFVRKRFMEASQD